MMMMMMTCREHDNKKTRIVQATENTQVIKTDSIPERAILRESQDWLATSLSLYVTKWKSQI
jgi:hypothetical protein